METLALPLEIEDLRSDLLKLDSLPTLPEAADYHRVIIQRQGCSVREIKRAILLDPPLSATILREASSHLATGTEPPKSIDDAVQALPEGALRKLCSHQPKLSSFAPWNELNVRSGILWQHAVGTGILAKALHSRKRMLHSPGPDPYLAGLLHHIGWFALDAIRPALVRKAIRRFHQMGSWTLQDERDLLGHDHAEIGAMLLEAWGIHPDLVAVVRHHHDPSKAGRLSGHAALIQVASSISPEPFPLEIALDHVESSLPNRLRFHQGPHLLEEMRSRYGRYINQAMNGSKLMLSWL